jgi:hypothetical protein
MWMCDSSSGSSSSCDDGTDHEQGEDPVHPTLDCTPHAAAIVGEEPDAIGMNVTAGRLSSTFPFVSIVR